MGKIPLQSQDMLLAILYCPVSDFSAEKNKDVTFLQPEIRQLNFALLPEYRRLCEYSINNFEPSEIQEFEQIVKLEIIDMDEFNYQELLFEIARTNQKDPDKHIANLIGSIKEYYARNPDLDVKLATFINDKYHDQLETKELIIEIGD